MIRWHRQTAGNKRIQILVYDDSKQFYKGTLHDILYIWYTLAGK